MVLYISWAYSGLMYNYDNHYPIYEGSYIYVWLIYVNLDCARLVLSAATIFSVMICYRTNIRHDQLFCNLLRVPLSP